MSPGHGIVTTADIARALNLSRSTVSRALNDHGLVNAQTKALVRENTLAMEFLPNRAARSLRRNRTLHLGVVVFFVPHLHELGQRAPHQERR